MTLARALLAAWLAGLATTEAVREAAAADPEVRQVVALLAGAPRPMSAEALELALREALGWGEERVARFVEEMRLALSAAPVAPAIAKRLRDRVRLLRLAQEVSRQLQTGRYDPDALAARLGPDEAASPIRPLAELLSDDGQPGGPMLSWGIPALDDVTGGVLGMTVVVGAPGVGKSDLALQAAALAQRQVPVLCYDLDNGYQTIRAKLLRLVGGDPQRLARATQRLYLREITSLGSDLRQIEPPALVVLDMLQNVPIAWRDDHWTAIQRWVYRLKELRRRGYTVLVVSEANRPHYHVAELASARGSGAIESAASVVLQLTPTEGGALATVLKHRHRPGRGQTVRLVRPGGGGLWVAEGEPP